MIARAWVAVLLASSGCSYAFVDRPPRAVRVTDRNPPPSCTRSLTLPVLDGVIGVSGIVAGIGIATGVIEPKDTDASGMQVETELSTSGRVFVGTIALVESALFIVSSVYGLRQTRACRQMWSTMPAGGAP